MTLCGGNKFTEFQIDCLEAHNNYRIRHGVQLLDLNKGLCKYAEAHANYLMQCDSERSSKGPYGENIFIKRSSRKVYPDPFEPVMQWYSEIRNWDSSNNYATPETKHFAQVVWKSTETMGVGHAINLEKNKIYVVASYYPAGGDHKTFCKNVKPLKACQRDCPSEVKII